MPGPQDQNNSLPPVSASRCLLLLRVLLLLLMVLLLLMLLATDIALADAPAVVAACRSGLQEAIRTRLDTAVAAECSVALVARISCGIYAGPHGSAINKQLPPLCEELMREEVAPGRTRATYFEAVLIPALL